jgi:hypothetical protein
VFPLPVTETDPIEDTPAGSEGASNFTSVRVPVAKSNRSSREGNCRFW